MRYFWYSEVTSGTMCLNLNSTMLLDETAIKYSDMGFLFYSVCGDGFCEEEEGCSICPADCGECPLSADAKIAIALPIGLVCTAFIMTVLVSKLSLFLFLLSYYHYSTNLNEYSLRRGIDFLPHPEPAC